MSGILLAGIALGGEAAALTLMYTEGDGGAHSDTDATYIRDSASHSGLNFGSDASLLVENDSSQGTTRTLIAFGDIIGAGSGQIATGSTVTSATLKLVTGSNNADGSADIHSVHQVLSGWDEDTVTWDSFNMGGVAGVDFVASALATYTPADFETAYEIDVTAAVQAWANGEDNFGLMILNPGADRSTYASDDSAYSSWRPMLIVELSMAVPEPSTALLVGIGLVLLAGRRRAI